MCLLASVQRLLYREGRRQARRHSPLPPLLLPAWPAVLPLLPWDNTEPWLYSALDEASELPKISIFADFEPPQGSSENPSLCRSSQRKKKCHLLDSSLWGGKALVLLLDSRPPVLLHAVNNQLHAMCIHCLGLILLQSRVLRLSSQVQLPPHLGCHRCLSGRKFTASDGGPGAPGKLFFQWCRSWSTVPAQSGAEPSGAADVAGQKGAPHSTKGPPGLSGGGTYLPHGTLSNLPDPHLCDPPLQRDKGAGPQTFSSLYPKKGR